MIIRYRGNQKAGEIVNYIIAANTDIGTTKNTNQDSLNVKVVSFGAEKAVFAVLCDGVGGLQKGEVASASVVNAYSKWSLERLPKLIENGIRDSDIRKDWIDIATEYNDKIKIYGKRSAANLGTTVTVMLVTDNRYYILNIGDTRAYEINNTIKVLTKDHTVVAREVELGNLTEEEAKSDARRSVLLQCIGASDDVYPDMFFGDVNKNSVYMLCSDGFRHEITNDEILLYFNPDVMIDADGMKRNIDFLIELNKSRGEQDNISAIAIRTY